MNCRLIYGGFKAWLRVRTVIEVSAPAIAMPCCNLLSFFAVVYGRGETESAMPDFIFLCSRFRRCIDPRVSIKRSSAPLLWGRFCRMSRREGVRNRMERSLGRALVVAKTSG